MNTTNTYHILVLMRSKATQREVGKRLGVAVWVVSQLAEARACLELNDF